MKIINTKSVVINRELQEKGHRLALLHPAEIALLKEIERIGYGRLESVVIKDSLPIRIEKVTQQVQLGDS